MVAECKKVTIVALKRHRKLSSNNRECNVMLFGLIYELN